MHTYTVTDEITGTAITGDSENIIRALHIRHLSAPTEIYDAIRSLEDALDRHEDTAELETLLAISVEHHAR